MESKLKKSFDKISWKTSHIAKYDDKNTYAKVSKSSDNRSVKIELSRLPNELYDDILKYITNKVNGEC